MSRAYYYFIASLPLLYWGEKPPFSAEEFLKDCQRFLSSEDYRIIRALLTDEDFPSPKNSDVLTVWENFNQDLRNEIAWFRAKRDHKDPKEFLRKERTTDSSLTEFVASAAKASDPLAVEKVFDVARWQLLDNLLTGHYFDRGVLFVYGLKLKMLEKYQKLDTPQARAVFDTYKNIALPALSAAS